MSHYFITTYGKILMFVLFISFTKGSIKSVKVILALHTNTREILVRQYHKVRSVEHTIYDKQKDETLKRTEQ